MKKKWLALGLSVLMAVSMTACGSSKEEPTTAASTEAKTTTTEAESSADSTTTAATSEAADDRTTLIVGFDAEYPPYGYMDDKGDYTGFDLELAEAVCELRGWELVKTPIDWTAKDMELNSGAIDCIWNGFTMNGNNRETMYTWSVPYVDNSQVIVAGKDSGITKLEDLAGKTVGVQAASAALELLEDAEKGRKELADTFAGLQQYPDYNSAFMDLEAGAIDAIAMDIGVAKYQIENRTAGDFVQLEEVLATEQYGVGFKLGNETLRDQVNESLMELVENGTFTTLAEKYGLTDFVIYK